MRSFYRRSYKQYSSYYLYGLILLLAFVILRHILLIGKIILVMAFLLVTLKYLASLEKVKIADLDFDHMSGIEFEQFLRFCYERQGYHVTMTKASGDYGADFLLEKKGSQYVVQAKRYQNKVGIKAVQEVIGAREFYHATYAIVITNNQFTKNAKKLASRSNVILLDGCDLYNLLDV